MGERRIINIDAVGLEDAGNGKCFRGKKARLGSGIGSTGLGCTLVVLAPGEKAFPMHRHHILDELFYIVAGEGEVRLDGETLPVRVGDVIANPAGKEAHQIVNSSNAELKYLAISTMGEADIVEYPDSGKLALAAGIKGSDFAKATIKGVGRLQPTGYFDGEPET